MLNGGPATKEFELISLETTTYTNLCLKYKKTSHQRKYFNPLMNNVSKWSDIL